MTYTLVVADDWQGFYIDGQLVAEDHRFSPSRIMELIGINLTRIDAYDSDQLSEYIDYHGAMPDNLNEISDLPRG
jgi:hypothetical protein